MSAPFEIKDRPGVITVAEMRQLFEDSVNNTARFKAHFPLGIIEVYGQFRGYFNHDVDMLWVGFATGLRCAERVNNAGGLVGPGLKVKSPGEAAPSHNKGEAK